MDDELFDEFPGKRADVCPFDPPPALTSLRESGRLVRVRSADGHNPWLITGYQDGRTALADPAFSADPTMPGWSEKGDAFRATLGTDKNLRTMDDPEHAAQKRMLVQEFTVKRLSAMQPAIRKIVDDRLEELAVGPQPADLISQFTMQVPIVVICELLGVPYEDSEFFAERSEKAIGDSTYEEAAQAGADLREYVVDLVAKREREPNDGLISRIIAQHVASGAMSRRELIDTVRLLIIAGFETTANQLGMSILVLLQHPDILAEIRDTDDEALINNAVEELLRFLSIVHQGRRRVAVRDVEVAGCPIRAGQPIIVAANTGDRDPAVFPNPDVLDIRRPNAKAHVAFGYGIHQCLGQHLSRMELRYAIPALLRRFPGLQLAVPFDEISFKEGATVYGAATLPVRW
ncbi:MAG: hypothetical protein ABS81_02870 [Pseudonocardia sp. SCN 72-86]|nr:MAG: hypothetical protein ABS81_02870 [Pseudonocardia sp. SCN 72-86]